jgi:hypothetical protein
MLNFAKEVYNTVTSRSWKVIKEAKENDPWERVARA